MRAAIFGCEGPILNDWEEGFFRQTKPLGFILFQRNCKDPAQVRRLVADLRACIERPNAPVLIDQEGGRVARLKPPYWSSLPAAGKVAALAEPANERGLQLAAYLIARQLRPLGINVDCAPLLDLPIPGSDEIIGDRALGSDLERVTRLGRFFCQALMAAGVLPVIKHIPGHGRATVDSHKDLPKVATSHEELSTSDFAAFRALADMPLAMTAHVRYESLDPDRPATLSKKIIDDVIRDEIGFAGFLMSDDLSMQALGGPIGIRARDALAAGCDCILHCNGDRTEMLEVARELQELSDPSNTRLAAALNRLKTSQASEAPDRPSEKLTFSQAYSELEHLLQEDAT
jgi:beta-N-acetylhexosaminidase